MMGQTKTAKRIGKRTLLLLSVMAATLMAASGAALAVNKACPSGTTEQNPCLGTDDSTRIVKKKKKKRTIFVPGNDTLIGTSGADYIKALSGNDNISGGAGDDTTDGGAGDDTYSYTDGWGIDTLVDSGGTDTLNFSAVGGGAGVFVELVPELGENYAKANGVSVETRTELSSGAVVEKVTGSSKYDNTIATGGANNTLQPGPGAGGAYLVDYGGCPSTICSVAIPASSDTYSGFAASGYGPVAILDDGGTADKLVLPFASTDFYFETFDQDGLGGEDTLIMLSSSSDSIYIRGQLEPAFGQKGHIEQIQFTDTILSIGSENPQTQRLSADKTTTDSAEARVQKLNEASSLDDAEKEKRKEAAKKMAAESDKKAQDLDEKSSTSGGEKKR